MHIAPRARRVTDATAGGRAAAAGRPRGRWPFCHIACGSWAPVVAAGRSSGDRRWDDDDAAGELG